MSSACKLHSCAQGNPWEGSETPEPAGEGIARTTAMQDPARDGICAITAMSLLCTLGDSEPAAPREQGGHQQQLLPVSLPAAPFPAPCLKLTTAAFLPGGEESLTHTLEEINK